MVRHFVCWSGVSSKGILLAFHTSKQKLTLNVLQTACADYPDFSLQLGRFLRGYFSKNYLGWRAIFLGGKKRSLSGIFSENIA